MTPAALADDRTRLDGPHVYSCEWTSSERVFRVDGRVHHRERRGVARSRQCIVRSALTCDYEVVDVVEVVEPSGGGTLSPVT